MITSSTTALSLLKAGALSASKKGAAQDNPLASVLSRLDPEKADALRKKQQDAQNILKQLGGSRSEVAQQRKSDAAEKVQQIKQKLKALRLMASINPKAAARQAAQLSRELAQAVKEYAQASGGGMPSATAGAADAPATDDASVKQAQGAGEAAQGDDGAAKDAAAEAKAEANAIVREAGGKDDSDADDSEGADDAKTLPPTVKEQVEAQIKELTEKSARDRADSEFMRQAQDVKNTLKSIIEQAKKKLEQKGDTSAEQDVKDAESAFREMDRYMKDISNGGGAAGVFAPVNLLV